MPAKRVDLDGGALRDARIAAGYRRQGDLAQALGFSQPRVSELEGGARVNYGTLLVLAAAVRSKPEQLTRKPDEAAADVLPAAA